MLCVDAHNTVTMVFTVVFPIHKNGIVEEFGVFCKPQDIKILQICNTEMWMSSLKVFVTV